MAKPKNVILIVADSLRYDAVYRDSGPGVPYLEQNATQFTNARSAACWTLPATTSMFSGMMPHQHGATSQSRWFKNEVPSLATKLKAADYKAMMVTANIVTTDLFNVAQGFDEIHRTWQFTPTKHKWLLQTVLALNRPRVRKMILKPKDQFFDKASEDLRQGIIWAQKTSHDSFAKAKQLIKETNDKGQGAFVFINLMETHYPYHIADTFTLMNKTLLGKIHEWRILFHFLSQSFLKNDKGVVKQADLDLLRTKQQLAWKLIRDDVNNFCREMHEGQDNLIVFCSDHGDNFGDQGWQYHFSNVTDGGNKVPLFWLDHENPKGETKTHNVSSRFMHHEILNRCGLDNEGGTLFTETENNLPILQSYWYNNEEQTMSKYKYNQIAFIEGDKRFVQRAGQWMYAPVGHNTAEPTFEFVDKNFNPLHELNLSPDRKKYLEKSVNDFSQFSEKIMSKGK
ncbi:MAG TPA: sulfatase-like hydrolase/transferase [Chitinophagales bacterium]|nr:sulfatase-like hydrolase/transferase [Chitinophagales bacterium]